MKKISLFVLIVAVLTSAIISMTGCSSKKGAGPLVMDDAATLVYREPGKYDDYYAFLSGGFSGQMAVYGLPTGRLLRIIPVFSVNPESGYGYSEETKAMLNTSYGFIPWDDSHHSELSMTNGEVDGRWIFINGNNTPRIARIDLKTFETAEIIEIPNSAGNHSSPFITENTEYVIAGTRFSIPIENKDVPINSYAENFKGVISFVKVNPESGNMNIEFQIVTPGLNYDLSHSGKGPSKDWFFFSCYNSEKANTLLEVNASKNDKDFIMAVNWKKAEQYLKDGKAKKLNSAYYHNVYDEKTQAVKSEILNETNVLYPADCPDMVFYIPCPKSPHGCDVNPTGEFIVGAGKLAAVIPVFSFEKMIKAIENKDYAGDVEGIPVLKYESVLKGEVQQPGLGPLHTEFDDKGFGYTSMFLSSEIVKWNVQTLEVVDRLPVYYSVGHLMIPGGDSKKPFGKYLLSMNKITKDRFLPTGPELMQSAQLIDISGDKMKLLLDFPTVGEPHYAQSLPAELLVDKQLKIYKLEDNDHPFATKSENDARAERNGSTIHLYMTAIRSHLAPDNIEGIQLGDTVYFHVTNLEQDWDIPHGFTIKGSKNSELLIMPGQTRTLKWVPERIGVVPFYCTDFCSALHQEMSGYLRVSPKGSDVKLSYLLGEKN